MVPNIKISAHFFVHSSDFWKWPIKTFFWMIFGPEMFQKSPEMIVSAQHLSSAYLNFHNGYFPAKLQQFEVNHIFRQPSLSTKILTIHITMSSVIKMGGGAEAVHSPLSNVLLCMFYSLLSPIIDVRELLTSQSVLRCFMIT